jgi:hypothetical protein
MAGLLTAAFGCGKARPYFRAAAKSFARPHHQNWS